MRGYFLMGLAWLVAATACHRQVRSCGGDCACFSSDDCPADSICFLGTCQDSGFNIDSVYIDLMPSSASGFLPQADTGTPRDLSRGLNLTFGLRPTHTVAGQITSTGGSIGGLVTARVHQFDPNAVLLPSMQTQQQAVVGTDSTFSMSVPPGVYDVAFAPTQAGNATLPPLTLNAYAIQRDDNLTLNYPAAALVQLTGHIMARLDAFTPVNGAQVSGTAQDANGMRLTAAVGTTDPNGQYTLTFLPGGSQYSVTTHPGAAPFGNPLVPTMIFAPLTPVGGDTTRPDGVLGTQILDIPATAVAVNVTVLGADGTLVPGAAVQFSGTVGTRTASGTFQAGTTSTSAASVQVTLLAGVYDISVLPLNDQTYAATRLTAVCIDVAPSASPNGCSISLSDDANLALPLGLKVSVTGVVTDSVGLPVAGAHVEYSTALDSSSRRSFATTSAVNGAYAIDVDPGTANAPLAYELNVEASQSSAIPRYRELLRVADTPVQHDVRMYAPAFVYGHVLDPTGAGLPDVTIALYSADLGSAGQPLLIGLGKSTTGGEFVIPIPTASSAN